MQRQVNWQVVFSKFNCDFIATMSSVKSFEEATKTLEDLKEKAKIEYKKLAFECHPDRNGGDDTKIKDLNVAYDLVKQVNIIKPQPRPQVRCVIIHSTMNGWGNATTTTTNTYTSSAWWPR
jgi:hypothetical protein